VRWPRGSLPRHLQRGDKALVGSHGHHGLAQKLAGKVAEKLSDEAADAALAKMKGRRDD